jgi:hypothetical protein
MENATGKDDGHWRLIAPLVSQSDVAGMIFTVPTGFITDLGSVPRVPIAYLLAGTSNEASVVHDFLYSTHPVPRNTADAVLREASAVTGRACLAPVADMGRRADRPGTAQRRPDLCGAGWLRAGQCPLAHINHLAPVAIPVTRSQCRWNE